MLLQTNSNARGANPQTNWSPDMPIISLRDVHKSFGAVEVLKGGRELLELREALRRRTVANVRRELARFDHGAVAPDLQIEMLVATMGHTIARHVEAGRTAELPDALEPALAMAGACVPLPALA